MRRRDFLRGAATSMAIGSLMVGRAGAQDQTEANDRISVCVAGVRGRGGLLLNTFAAQNDVEVKCVCDVDESVLNAHAEAIEKQTGRRPQAIKDFRRALDDPELHALVLGTPDHWHAIPTILACQAGKDVYVEKPDGHNVIEGRTMVAAMKKHGRIVQLGTQSRSGPHVLEAIAYIASGKLGKVRFAKAWESARQGSIGHTPDSEPPPGVDYDLWLGPAPLRPFNQRRFHGSWRWFFDYGTGDLGNDGVHRLDIARWAIETARAASGEETSPYPRAVSAQGGKYYFDDDQEWPDTLMVSYDYPGYVVTYEMRIWSPYPMEGESEGAAVFGDQGYVIIGNSRWRAYAARDELVAEGQGGYNDAGHVRNFLESMRSREKPVADLETVGHPASLLCHLGNIAWRAGCTIHFDPDTCTLAEAEARQFLVRAEYRKPWVLPEV
ncbi:MAG: Gfo/Idh/MocA family oxidoreductase [Thermoguttaceae bacterium]|nr:Gfo/Idh/MocA family oxidoreductase [Thermoguttaceae bacterium]